MRYYLLLWMCVCVCARVSLKARLQKCMRVFANAICIIFTASHAFPVVLNVTIKRT